MINKERQSFLIIGLILSAVILSGFIYSFLNGDNKKNDIQTELNDGDKVGTSTLVRRVIDGVYVREGEENHFPFSIMIDNHTDARPPVGLEKANLVIEAEAEGGITRYFAVFAGGEKIDKIGPIRSARPYFVDWAKDLSSLYVHVGGSPAALVQIEKDNVFHINEFYNGSYFWRDKGRYAPHNIFTSSENVKKYLDKNSAGKSQLISRKYKEDKPKDELPDSSVIEIGYPLYDYKVEWKFDRENNNYVRYLGGKAHATESGEYITAKNIIIQVVRAEEIDDKLRLDMKTVGEGESIVCLDGECSTGTWKKKSKNKITSFYEKDDEEFEFNAGTTWIEVVRPERYISY